ncbi:hypothetical protein ONE63_003175 [Megalurothrips usitatus]|uniref:Uncharacterized protein n=1 Tax=Megalurothrips usitatus TaxID=439358 RepID=A0AAV7X8Y3_9NEOP|nr:hypothetical protein ONE63_003175 [Megalurothrips usitatus]
MKLVLAAVLGLLALGQACAAEEVKVSATTSGLDEEEQAIVQGFLTLIQGVIAAGGDPDKMQDTLNDIKARVERKLNAQGASYLNKLAKTLSSVQISQESLDGIVKSITDIADQDGVSLKSRARRSPAPKKKKWKKKKGKKGCGK